MYTQEFLDSLKQQEADLRLSSFDLEDAYTLGTMLREAGKKEPEPIAVRIVLDGLIVYQSFLPGTGLSNSQWMDRKYATVCQSRHSSLRAAVERELNGIQEPWQSDEEQFAFCGGGFPLVVDGKFRGAVIVSGLPHLEDHRCLTDTMAAFLKASK